MTTAHRPTFTAAQGSSEQGGRFIAPSQQMSAKDLPGQLTLKHRQIGQNAATDVAQRDLKAELRAREEAYFAQKAKTESLGTEDVLSAPDADRKKKLELMDRDDDFSDGGGDSSGSDDDDDDDDDEEAELMRELERIKAERAEEAAKKELEQRREEEQKHQAAALRGNPLLNSESFTVKRRWDDDVVFKNQARGEEPAKKRFINDTIRNDFHKKFLAKYIQ